MIKKTWTLSRFSNDIINNHRIVFDLNFYSKLFKGILAISKMRGSPSTHLRRNSSLDKVSFLVNSSKLPASAGPQMYGVAKQSGSESESESDEPVQPNPNSRGQDQGSESDEPAQPNPIISRAQG